VLLAAGVTAAGIAVTPALGGYPARAAATSETAPAASGFTAATVAQRDNAALNWAETQRGHWYCWGGAGPCFDCSGLVMWAFAHVGIALPHNTVAMVRSGKLVRTWSPRRGDLAFWGPIGAPYHVEFVTIWYRTTFGALHSGTRIGWHRWGPGWAPSAFYRVI